jgi:hypothetical protein
MTLQLVTENKPEPAAASGDETVRAKRAETALIRECVIYAQSVAAWAGGFDADPDGDSAHAAPLGKSHFARAEQALAKISRTPAMTAEGLQAKARIVPAIMKAAAGCVMDKEEGAFLSSFGADVKAFLEPILDDHRARVRRKTRKA